MQNVIELDPRYTIATFAPDREALEQAAEEGFRTVVNLKTREEKQEITPDAEAELADRAGLAYLHRPVSPEALDADLVDTFRQELSEISTPALVHCASGKRAGAMTLMALAAEKGWSGEEALSHGRKHGLDLTAEKIGDFVKSYLDDRSRD